MPSGIAELIIRADLKRVCEFDADFRFVILKQNPRFNPNNSYIGINSVSNRQDFKNLSFRLV